MMDDDVNGTAAPSRMGPPPTTSTNTTTRTPTTVSLATPNRRCTAKGQEEAVLREEGNEQNPPSVVDAALALQQQLRTRLLAHAARRIQRLWRQYKEEVASTVCPDEDEDEDYCEDPRIDEEENAGDEGEECKSCADSSAADDLPPLPKFHRDRLRGLESREASPVPSQQQLPASFAGIDTILPSAVPSQPGSFSFPQKQSSSNNNTCAHAPPPPNADDSAPTTCVAVAPITTNINSNSNMGRSQQLHSAAARIEEAWRRYRKAVALEEQLQKEARWDAARRAATTAAVASSAVLARARAVPTSPTGSTVSAVSGSFAIPSMVSITHQHQSQQPRSASALSVGAVPAGSTAAQQPAALPAPALNLSQDDLEAMLQEREDDLEERSAHAALLELEREMGRSSSTATANSASRKQTHSAVGARRGDRRAASVNNRSCSSSGTGEGRGSDSDYGEETEEYDDEEDSDDDDICSIISHALLRSASSRRGSTASLLLQRPPLRDSGGGVAGAGGASSGRPSPAPPPTAASSSLMKASSTNNALIRATAAVLIQRALRERSANAKGGSTCKPAAAAQIASGKLEAGARSGGNAHDANDNDATVDDAPSSLSPPPSALHFDPAVKGGAPQPQFPEDAEEAPVSSPHSLFDVPDLPESVENALRILQNRFRFGILRRNLRARDRDDAARRVQEAWRRRRAIASHFEAVANGRREAAAREIQMAFRATRLNRRGGDRVRSAGGAREGGDGVNTDVGSAVAVDSPIAGGQLPSRPLPMTTNTPPPPVSLSASAPPSSSLLPLCVICMTDVVQVALLPCGHAHLCGECASCLNRCPACRKRVALQIRIFL